MSITFGQSAPSSITTNLDALFATSLANYKRELNDNISESNPFFHEIKKNGTWESCDGGAYIAEDLMYELGTADAYDGYDELPDEPTDGITQVIFQWRQGAVPISYSQKEKKQNKQRLVNLVKAKITQAEGGFTEFFNKAFLQGGLMQGGSTLTTPYQSLTNGAYFIEPLNSLVDYTPTTSREVGNINQSTYSWWRNRTKVSAATTYAGWLLELDNLNNTCSRGPGGPPKLGICDQTTYELLNAAYYQQYRTQMKSDANYPFENVMFRKMHIVWDQYVTNVFAGTTDTTTTTGGTFYMLNPKNMKVRYESETDFTMTEFQKPPKGDSRLAHILFMGQTTINNRRKQGVMGKIARSLT